VVWYGAWCWRCVVERSRGPRTDGWALGGGMGDRLKRFCSCRSCRRRWVFSGRKEAHSTTGRGGILGQAVDFLRIYLIGFNAYLLTYWVSLLVCNYPAYCHSTAIIFYTFPAGLPARPVPQPLPNQSQIQPLLPPHAPGINSRIPPQPNRRRNRAPLNNIVEHHLRRIIALHRKNRHRPTRTHPARHIRAPRHREIRDVRLHGVRDGRVDRSRQVRALALVERGQDIDAVDGGRDRELVVVRVVRVGAGQVVGVAGEDLLGDELDCARDGRGPGVCAVVDGRVEDLEDVIYDAGCDGWVGGFEVGA